MENQSLLIKSLCRKKFKYEKSGLGITGQNPFHVSRVHFSVFCWGLSDFGGIFQFIQNEKVRK